MNALILTEGSANWGQGHLTRCLAIAQGLKPFGIQSVWLVQGDSVANEFISSNNIRGDVVNWIYDADLHVDINDFQLCIVDSYHADIKRYERLASSFDRCLWLDDEARLDYPRGYVLNPNPLVRQKVDRDGAFGKLLLSGFDYQPLREEFSGGLRSIQDGVRHVLISMGGTDVADLTPKIIDLVRDVIPRSHISAIVPLNEKRNTWKQIPREDCEFYAAQTARGMRDLMDWADIAITAGGQTVCETACTGLPTIAIGVAENQRQHLSALQQSNAVIVAGWHTDSDICDRVATCIKELSSISVRSFLSKQGQITIDGRGVDRIVRMMSLDQFKLVSGPK